MVELRVSSTLCPVSFEAFCAPEAPHTCSGCISSMGPLVVLHRDSSVTSPQSCLPQILGSARKHCRKGPGHFCFVSRLPLSCFFFFFLGLMSIPGSAAQLLNQPVSPTGREGEKAALGWQHLFCDGSASPHVL